MGPSLSPRPLLLLGLSLLLGSLQALTCFKCGRISATGVCERGEGSCETRDSQQCFLKKVYEGGTFQYGYQGCGALCIPMSLFNRRTELQIECCKDVPFCNGF